MEKFILKKIRKIPVYYPSCTLQQLLPVLRSPACTSAIRYSHKWFHNIQFGLKVENGCWYTEFLPCNNIWTFLRYLGCNVEVKGIQQFCKRHKIFQSQHIAIFLVFICNFSSHKKNINYGIKYFSLFVKS